MVLPCSLVSFASLTAASLSTVCDSVSIRSGASLADRRLPKNLKSCPWPSAGRSAVALALGSWLLSRIVRKRARAAARLADKVRGLTLCEMDLCDHFQPKHPAWGIWARMTHSSPLFRIKPLLGLMGPESSIPCRSHGKDRSGLARSLAHSRAVTRPAYLRTCRPCLVDQVAKRWLVLMILAETSSSDCQAPNRVCCRIPAAQLGLLKRLRTRQAPRRA